MVMDGGLGNEVAPGDVVDDEVHFRGKEAEFSLSLRQPEPSNVVECSDEAAVRSDGEYLDSSFDVISGILEGRTGNGSVGDGSGARFSGDGGNMVEELLVKKNYDGSNLPIVGMSNHREKLESRWTQWQPHYQLGVGSGSGSSRSNVWHMDDGQTASPCENNNAQNVSSSEFMGQGAASNDLSNEAVGQLVDTEHMEAADMVSRGGIRTKILSKSGFADFFIKNTLKGKGTVFRGHPHNVVRHEPMVQENGRTPNVMATSCGSVSTSVGEKTVMPSASGVARPRHGGVDHDGVSLREWLNVGRHVVDKVECFHIFRRIVDLVDSFHSKGAVLSELRPSCFKLLPSKQVRYLGSADKRDDLGSTLDQDVPCLGNHASKKRMIDQGLFSSSPGLHMKKQKLSENMNAAKRWPQFSVKYGSKLKTGEADFGIGQQFLNDSTGGNPNMGHGAQSNLSFPRFSKAVQQQLSTCGTDPVEEKWYASPEELTEGIHTMSSNVYALGVLLFELLSHFDSERARATAMSDLCNRILPPHFLSENLKEAGFCLLLLHPEPSSRLTTREILQSDVINGLPDMSVEELSSAIEKDDAESELLSYFLVSLKAHKQSTASKLMNDIKCLEADIKEVERRNYSNKSQIQACTGSDFHSAKEHSFQKNDATAEGVSPMLSNLNTKEMRLMRNISQLESAYFSMRGKVQVAEANPTARQDKYLLRNREIWQSEEEAEGNYNSADCLGEFFDGLCKYARYSKFQVRGSLRTGEFNNSANVICSLSFDRDKDYFAAAGVSKKIKIYDFGSLFNDSVDIHYPAVEMSNKSKLSCICWNTYIKNYLASTDYDGVVKLWDASTGQGVSQYNEHQRRAWSVDFSPVYPTKLATGSDDCTVKLWSINEKNSLATIRNIANVCCVQFSSHSTHLLAFGSADFRTYCFDTRHVRIPWCTLSGHERAVSYVKFVDADTIVTASTDNSLKLWDLKKTNGSGLSMDACSSTLRGHTNEKNFVGLSVADGYISCGSETNEVYAYHRSVPMPMASHKFGSEDPISGKETEDDNGQFVSSVCWKGNSDMLLAANSSGCIKVLQMV